MVARTKEDGERRKVRGDKGNGTKEMGKKKGTRDKGKERVTRERN